MKKNIICSAAALCIAAMGVGCSDRPETGTEDTLTYYELSEGELRFAVSSELTEFDSDQSGHSFDVNGSEGEISVLELPRLHQTAKGYAGDMAKIYEEDGFYSNILVEEDLTSGREPSYRITASSEDGSEMAMDIVQYGDSVLFGVLSAYPAGDSKCAAEVKKILDSVEYTGAPPKTEDEPFENDLFTASVSPEWYVVNDDDAAEGSFVISYNRYDDYRLSASSFTLKLAESEYDAALIADMMYMAACESYEESKDSMSEPKRSSESFLGENAEKVTYTVTSSDLSIARVSWFFENGEHTYNAEVSCPADCLDKYIADLTPVLDSISFK